MVTKERRSSRSFTREYLNSSDYILDQYRQGHISERECRSLYDQTLARLVLGLEEIFHTRVELSRTFRHDAPDADGASSPVSPSDG